MDTAVTIILLAEAALAWLLFRSLSATGRDADVKDSARETSESVRRDGTSQVAGLIFGTLLPLLLITAAFAVRACLLDYETTDYQWFLTKWVDYFRDNGGFAALRNSVGNYNIPYLYFLAFFSYLPVRDLYLIKLLSILFDVILAYACGRLVLNAGGKRTGGTVCFFAVLFLPTVIANSAKWAQCDSMYVSLAVLAAAVAIGDDGRREARQILAMALLACSFGFKLQAVFIMPVFVVIWAWKKYRWVYFAVFPLTYLLLILPAVILGRPLSDALMLYADQAGTVGTALNYNSPSMTAFMKSVTDTASASTLCLVLAFFVMFLLMGIGIRSRRKLGGGSMTDIILLNVMLIPFLLPHMHDRYFYLADCLTVVFACLYRRSDSSAAQDALPLALRALPAVFMQFGSLICYIAYFNSYYARIGRIVLTSDRGAAAVIIAAAIVAADLLRCFADTGTAN